MMMMARRVLTFRMQCTAFLISLLMLPLVLIYCLWRIYIIGWSNFFKKIFRPTRPAVLDDPMIGEHGFIRKKNGLRLHYVARGPKEGPLLLLLHGFPESWYSWRYQLNDLSYMYRVVALDLRGFGESDKPEGVAHYAMPEIAHDISETISALGFDKCVLVGHGLGGVVAMATATLYGHQVERLVILNAPHLEIHFEQMGASLEHFFKSLYLVFVNIRYLAEIVLQSEDFQWFKLALTGFLTGAKKGTFTTDDLEAVKYYMGNEGTLSASLAYYRMMYQKKYMQQVPTSNIYAPTLMLWGTADFIFEPYLAALTKSRFIKNARIEYFQGASHWLQEEEPKRVNDLIIEFVETESSNLYLDDPAVHDDSGEESSDTLDGIHDDVLDDKDISWDDDVSWDGDSGHHSKMDDIENYVQVNPALIGASYAYGIESAYDEYVDIEETNTYELVTSVEDAKQFWLAQVPLVEKQAQKGARKMDVHMEGMDYFPKRHSLPNLV